MIKQNCEAIIKGNCDEYFTSDIDLSTKSKQEVNRIAWNKSKLTEDNIENNKLTLNYKGDDYEKKLDDLFKFIIKKLSDVYEKRKESLKLTSYSNFFKTDKTYQEIILKEIDRSLDDEWDKEKLQSFMSIFNDDQE